MAKCEGKLHREMRSEMHREIAQEKVHREMHREIACTASSTHRAKKLTYMREEN